MPHGFALLLIASCHAAAATATVAITVAVTITDFNLQQKRQRVLAPSQLHQFSEPSLLRLRQACRRPEAHRAARTRSWFSRLANATCRFRRFSGLLMYPGVCLTALIASQLLQRGRLACRPLRRLWLLCPQCEAAMFAQRCPEQPVWAHAAQTPPFPWHQRAR